MPSAILGLRGTGQFDQDHRPENYRQLYALLEPNGSAPLQALLSMAASESTDDPKYHHFRDELPDRYVEVGTGGATNNATTIPVTGNDASYIIEGTMLYNTRTGEVLRSGEAFDSTGNQIKSVTRGIGNSGAGVAMNEGDKLVVIGSAYAEGTGAPAALSWDAVDNWNLTQIFKQAIEVSGTLQNTHLRTGSKEQEALTKALKLHMADIERAMFFGKRDILNANTANPLRFTGGLLNMITSNQIDASTGFNEANIITEKEFDRLLIERLFAWGSKEKVVFGGPRAISNFMQIAKNRWQPTVVDNAYGVKFARYTTFAGDLLIYLHPMFRQIPDAEAMMVGLDLSYVKYRYMKNRDTHIKRNVQNNDQDGVKHQYMTECGLDLLQDKPHFVIRNWEDVDPTPPSSGGGTGD